MPRYANRDSYAYRHRNAFRVIVSNDERPCEDKVIAFILPAIGSFLVSCFFLHWVVFILRIEGRPPDEIDSDDEQTCAAKVGDCICGTIRGFLVSLFIAWLHWLIIFRPYQIHPHVNSAVLAAFDLAPDPADGDALGLRYDLALNVTFDHPKHIEVWFHHLTAGLYYNGTKLGPSDDTLPAFKLDTWHDRTVYPALRGRASGVGAAVAGALAGELAAGRLNVDVRVKTTLTYQSSSQRATYYYEYDCWLQFAPPPPGNGTPAVTGGVKCGVAKFDHT